MAQYDGSREGSGAGAAVFTGRSGRRYVLEGVAGAPAMVPARLYALAEGGVIRWAGTAQDLIGDHVSRERFRRAHAGAAQMLSMPAPADPLGVMTLIWDLEGGQGLAGRHAA